jgi:MFS family permease
VHLDDAQAMQATIVLFAVFAATVANATVFATVGLHGRSIGLSEFEVGAIFASSGVLFFLTSSRLGRLSDRVGRGPVMAAGLAATALSLLLFAGLYAAGGTFLGLLLARAIYGLLAGGILPAATAGMADGAVERRAAAVALVGAAAGIASIAGPLFAASVSGFGLAVPVAAGGALAALAAAAALAGLRDAPRQPVWARTEAPPVEGLGPYLLVGFAMVVGFGALQPTTAFYVQDRFALETAAAVRQASLASAGFAAGSFGVQAFAVRLLPLRPQHLLSFGLAICLLGIAGSLAATAPAALVAGFSAMGMGYGLAQSGLTAAVSILGGEHRQGQVAGRLQATLSAAWIVGALVGTALYRGAIAAPLLVAAGATALALGLAYSGVSPATSQMRR